MVKKIFLFLFTLVHMTAYSSQWEDDWIQAILCCEKKEFLNAEIFFSSSLAGLSSQEDIITSKIYVDRGRLFLLLDRNEEALSDLNKALNSNCLTEKGLLRAVVSRIVVNLRLGNDEDALSDISWFQQINQNGTEVNFTEKHIIIRNVPECECFREMITGYVVDVGMCSSKEDVKFLKSDICIIKRAKICDCGCDKQGGSGTANLNIDKNFDLGNGKNLGAFDCRNNCDNVAIGAQGMCYKWFKGLICTTGCLVAVETCRKLCNGCCSRGSFYESCVAPFKRIQEYIKEPCDPAWD